MTAEDCVKEGICVAVPAGPYSFVLLLLIAIALGIVISAWRKYRNPSIKLKQRRRDWRL